MSCAICPRLEPQCNVVLLCHFHVSVLCLSQRGDVAFVPRKVELGAMACIEGLQAMPCVFKRPPGKQQFAAFPAVKLVFVV